MQDQQGTAVPGKRRRLDRKNPAPARGRLYYWVSRRGLTHALIIDPSCGWCGEVHTYRAAGLRIASCGGGYVQIKARRAPRPAGTKCQQESVSAVSVSAADTFASDEHEPLNCANVEAEASARPLESVSADSNADGSQGSESVIEP